ncbi:MarR family transcriptional regulator [Frondihabitans sucicola]|uniref:MarR family transcriptional regulator n=1 Tax=Frondihabitans sucicola TaxID=1268041 RepID=A0ABM8GQX2_9MICO|nr:MarR family transcriptional regulator [Frondihabitans sucicola]BDZ50866.1 MarR family transcriptional regulator [Frondihabitans sucicola]
MSSPGSSVVSEGAQDPAPVDRDDVPARFAFAVGRLNRLLRPSGAALSPALLLALSTVVRRGPVRPSELGRIEGVAAPTATRLIVDLESRGLVDRTPDPDDGRSFFVEATAAGVDAVIAARRERAEHASALLATLDESGRAAVLDALESLEKLADSREL